MSIYKLVIDNGNLRGTTGHHEILCHIEETRDNGTVVQGIPAMHGIESTALEAKHGGNIDQWRDSVAQDMVRQHKARMLVHAEVLSWSGKKFDVP